MGICAAKSRDNSTKELPERATLVENQPLPKSRPRLQQEARSGVETDPPTEIVTVAKH